MSVLSRKLRCPRCLTSHKEGERHACAPCKPAKATSAAIDVDLNALAAHFEDYVSGPGYDVLRVIKALRDERAITKTTISFMRRQAKAIAHVLASIKNDLTSFDNATYSTVTRASLAWLDEPLYVNKMANPKVPLFDEDMSLRVESGLQRLGCVTYLGKPRVATTRDLIKLSHDEAMRLAKGWGKKSVGDLAKLLRQLGVEWPTEGVK